MRRLAGPGPEDQVVKVGALQVICQDSHEPQRQGCGAPAPGRLRVVEDEALRPLEPPQAATHRQLARCQIHVAPCERECLGRPRAGADEHVEERMPLRAGRGPEEALDRVAPSCFLTQRSRVALRSRCLRARTRGFTAASSHSSRKASRVMRASSTTRPWSLSHGPT